MTEADTILDLKQTIKRLRHDLAVKDVVITERDMTIARLQAVVEHQGAKLNALQAILNDT